MIHRLPWLLPLLILIIASGWWHDLHSNARAMQTQLATLRSPALSTAPITSSRAVEDPPSADEKTLAQLRQKMAAEKARLTSVQREIDTLAASLPKTHTDEIITSYGSIETMGREAGDVLRDFIACIEALKTQPSDREPDADTIMRLMNLHGRVPEIQNFEKQPVEIARFQSNALQQVFKLAPAATEQARQHIRTAFTTLAERHLTGAERPPENDSDWKQQRSAVLQDLMKNLRPLLPHQGSTDSEKSALTMVLNFGAGFDQEVKGHAKMTSLSWGLNWPKPPW